METGSVEKCSPVINTSTRVMACRTGQKSNLALNETAVPNEQVEVLKQHNLSACQEQYFGALPGGQMLNCSWPMKVEASNPSVSQQSWHDSETGEKSGSYAGGEIPWWIKVGEKCSFISPYVKLPLEPVLKSHHSMSSRGDKQRLVLRDVIGINAIYDHVVKVPIIYTCYKRV